MNVNAQEGLNGLKGSKVLKVLKVLLVDDEALARQRLRALLVACLDTPTQVVGEAQTAEQALEMVRSRDVDLLLLDIRMPGRDGLQLAAIADAEFAQVVFEVHEHLVECRLRQGFALGPHRFETGQIQARMHHDQVEPAVDRVRYVERLIELRPARLLDDGVVDERPLARPVAPARQK